MAYFEQIVVSIFDLEFRSKIGVYKASGGWNTSDIFSAWDDVTHLEFNGSVLTVEGANLWEVQYQNSVLYPSDDKCYFHTYYGYFVYGYWTD